MPPVPPQQKIQYAKQMLEDNNEARTIKDDKILEWAALDIAEKLAVITTQLGQIQTYLRSINSMATRLK